LVNNSVTVGGQSVALGGSAAVQGNGAKIQLSTGTPTSGNCAKFDANGNVVDNGAACGSGSTGITFTDGTHTVTGSTQLTVTGGTVGGTTPNATLTISGSGGGSLVKIGTATASNSTCLSWGVAVTGCVNGSTTDLSTLGYNTFELTCDSIKPGTGAGYFYLHVAEGATPTIETANYGWTTDYRSLAGATNGTLVGSSTASSNVGIFIANGIASTASLGGSARLHLNASSIPRSVSSHFIGGDATAIASNFSLRSGGVYTGDQNAVTAITFDLYSAANGTQETGAAALVSGSCTLYGLVN
jgi:hypothetical protein